MRLSGNEMLEHAREMSLKYHDGQFDKAGEPYYKHPFAVAELVGDDPVAKTVAYLHDIVEDTPVTLAQLEQEGFPPEVISGVDAMTRRDGETYFEFIERVGQNPVARQVKLADLAHNTDPSRSASLPERLSKRYAKAKEMLA